MIFVKYIRISDVKKRYFIFICMYARNLWTNPTAYRISARLLLATNPARQGEVARFDGDTARVVGFQVGFFEQFSKVGFGGLLKSFQGVRLEAQARLHDASEHPATMKHFNAYLYLGTNFPDHALEGSLRNAETALFGKGAILANGSGRGAKPVALGS